MKTASLLLAFPLLLPVCTSFAAPRELRSDGRYEFLDKGVPTRYVIARDEIYQRQSGKDAKRVFITAREQARSVMQTAREMEAATADRIDLIAYPEGQIPTDSNRRFVSRSVTMHLADGLDPNVIATSMNAVSYRPLGYAPGHYAYQFQDTEAAISAAQDLKVLNGVTQVTVELAQTRIPHALPADPLFLFGTANKGAQSFIINRDFADESPISPSNPNFNPSPKAYQWNLLNTGDLLPPPNLAPSVVIRPDSVPLLARPSKFCLYPPYFDIAADINVLSAWEYVSTNATPINGNGVKVAVIDDGVQYDHEDLGNALFDKPNSYNFIDGNPQDPNDPKNKDPMPPFSSGGAPGHGTGIAGIIFGRANNKGMIGIASGATMLAYRFLGGALEPSLEADAVVWGSKLKAVIPTPANPLGIPTGKEWRTGAIKFDVASCAWGPLSFGNDLLDEGPYMKTALAYGTNEGRNKKGVVYVFAAASDGQYRGDANYSYLTNSIYTISVGSVSDMGRRIAYSPPGASLNLVAPSQGYEMEPVIKRGGATFPATPPVIPDPLNVKTQSHAERAQGYTVSLNDYDNINAKLRTSASVVTLDAASTSTGLRADYNKNFSGTSASSAMVTGAAALMLEANQNLGYRDVMEILMRSARTIDPVYGEWTVNPLGLPFSHKYGAGMLDAGHAVAMARVWKPLGARAGGVGPDNIVKGISQTLSARNIPTPDNAKIGTVYNINPPDPGLRVEHVVVKLNVTHGRRGDLGITLTAPGTGQAGSAIESFLFVPHKADYNTNIGLKEGTDTAPLDTKNEDYEFVSVRHWGTTGSNPVLKENSTDQWTLRIWDNTADGATVGAAVDPNSTAIGDDFVYKNRVYNPVANPVPGSVPSASYEQKVVSGTLTFHGSVTPSENLSPEITTVDIVGRPGAALNVKLKAVTDLTAGGADGTEPRAPMLGYQFRVLGPELPTTQQIFTAPDSLEGYAAAFGNDGDPNPSFRFNLDTGLLSNDPFPGTPAPLVRTGTGGVGSARIVVNDLTDLAPGKFVAGGGIADGARIAPNGIDAATKTITLTATNVSSVAGEIRFTDVKGFAALQKGTWNLEISGTNVFGTTRKQVKLVVKDELNYDAWANTFSPPITDGLADPDGDGLSNIVEFVSGGQPYIKDDFEVPSASVVDGKLVFRYRLDTNALGKGVAPQVTDNLGTWTTVVPVKKETVGNITYYEVTLDPATDGEKKFFRLKVNV